MPDAPGLELIRSEIEGRHPGAVLGTSFDHGQAALVVDSAQVLDVLRWLRQTPGQEYTFLSSLHGVDYLPAEPRFAVHYELLNRDRVERVRVKAMLRNPGVDDGAPAAGPVAAAEAPSLTREGTSASTPPAEMSKGETAETGAAPSPGGGEEKLPVIDSCVELFPTAEFQEREVYDFFGIVFRGHPELTRILMPEDYVGWPLRRDFPVGGEPVTFTYNERNYG